MECSVYVNNCYEAKIKMFHVEFEMNLLYNVPHTTVSVAVELLRVLPLFVCSAVSQYQEIPANRPLTSEGKIIYPPAPLHYVNIGPQLEGDYKFGYDTGKGPLGQSFREEIRLIDGTVKGTYGVIDEKGHKRIVHYTAGKGGFIAAENADRPNSQLSSFEQQPKPFMQQNFNKLFQQFPVFKPANYLQTRVSVPMYIGTAPVKSADATSENKLPKFEKITKTTVLPPYRLPKPLGKEASVPLYRTSVTGGVQKTSVPAVPFHGSQPKDTKLKNIENLDEMYNLKPKAIITKKPTLPVKPQSLQTKQQDADQSHGHRFEEDYYDSSPAFIDIERLSYNIGTDKSLASV